MDTKTQNIVITLLGLILVVCLWFTFNLFGKGATSSEEEIATHIDEASRNIDLDFENVDVDIEELRAKYGNKIDSVYAAEFPEDEIVDYGKLLEEASTNYASKPASYDEIPPYMVIAGAFSTNANAQTFKNMLINKGFEDAEIVKFQSSKYTSICVNRTDNLSSARTKVEELKALNIEAYVHTRKAKK